MKEKLAMPCTQEQWEQEIKPRIEKIQGMNIYYIQDFNRYDYLVNNLCGNFGFISNQLKSEADCQARVLIPYDPDRFCASLGEEQPKWMPLTRGGYEYKIYEEVEGKIFGRVLHNSMSGTCTWLKNGIENSGYSACDLIPYNAEIEAIKQQIAIKEKELEELKRKLNGKLLF